MTKLIPSAILLGNAILISSLSAGQFGVVWSARQAGDYYAQINVPSACSVLIYPYASGSGGSYDPTLYNQWISPDYTVSYDYNFDTQQGTWTPVPGYTTSWGPSAWTYNQPNNGHVFAIVYGAQDYCKYEQRSTLYGEDSAESGQSTSGTYWIEINGFAHGDGQATANISISW